MAFLARCPNCSSIRRIDEPPFNMDELMLFGPRSHVCPQCFTRYFANKPRQPGTIVDGDTLKLFYDTIAERQAEVDRLSSRRKP